MAGSLDERRKRVRKQAEKARTSDKISPREVYQGNNMTGKFPFGGYSEDAQFFGGSTLQGGNYARQHMQEHSRAVAENNRRKQAAQKTNEQQRNRQWEEEFRRRSVKKK